MLRPSTAGSKLRAAPRGASPARGKRRFSDEIMLSGDDDAPEGSAEVEGGGAQPRNLRGLGDALDQAPDVVGLQVGSSQSATLLFAARC